MAKLNSAVKGGKSHPVVVSEVERERNGERVREQREPLRRREKKKKRGLECTLPFKVLVILPSFLPLLK